MHNTLIKIDFKNVKFVKKFFMLKNIDIANKLIAALLYRKK